MMAFLPFPLFPENQWRQIPWQHGGEFKLALADIIPGLVYGHVADGLFLGRTVV